MATPRPTSCGATPPTRPEHHLEKRQQRHTAGGDQHRRPELEDAAGIGDFNGDGKDDILWRNTSTGTNAIWGGASSGSGLAVNAVGDLNWKVAGIGDFNGDGSDDILWRNTSTGVNTIWRNASSATVQAVTSVGDLNWKVAGTGDFNGDGTDDILWRNARHRAERDLGRRFILQRAGHLQRGGPELPGGRHGGLQR